MESHATPMNLPNQLTVARIFMTMAFTVLLCFDHWLARLAAYILFIGATITDYYDGKIARERGLVTNFGKLLDPVADKVMISAAFVMLLRVPELCVPAWTVVVILAREFLITGARSLAAAQGTVIAANKYGKLKAVFQMVYVYVVLGFLILGDILALFVPTEAVVTYSWVLFHASLWGAVFVALYTVYTGLQFARINWPALNMGE